jgi:hypothetical protein
MTDERWFEVLVTEKSATSDKRFDVAHRYRGAELPEPGDIIEVESAGAGRKTKARVVRVVSEDQFPIRAIELPQ